MIILSRRKMPIKEPTKSQLKIRELNDEINLVARELQKEKDKYASQLVEAVNLANRKQRLRVENERLEENGDKILNSLRRQKNILAEGIRGKTEAEQRLVSSMRDFEGALVRAEESLREAKNAERQKTAVVRELNVVEALLLSGKEKIFQSEERVRLNNDKAKEVQDECAVLVRQAQEQIERVDEFNQVAEEWYKKLKFYARRLKKHLMSHGHPFPEELEDLRHEKVYFKNPNKHATTKRAPVAQK